MVRTKLGNKKLCRCGCGNILKSNHSTWYQGHHAYGVDGYKNRYVLKKEQKGRNRGKYPPYDEIIAAHIQFIKEAKINPDLCWGCQLIPFNNKCHIISVGQGGNNEPQNLILLCETCHIFQGWSDMIEGWSIENQYDWLKNFDLFSIKFELHQKGADQFFFEYHKRMYQKYNLTIPQWLTINNENFACM